MELALGLAAAALPYALVAATPRGTAAWIGGLAVAAALAVLWLLLNAGLPPFRPSSDPYPVPVMLVVLATGSAGLGVVARLLGSMARRLGPWGYPAMVALVPLGVAAALGLAAWR